MFSNLWLYSEAFYRWKLVFCNSDWMTCQNRLFYIDIY